MESFNIDYKDKKEAYAFKLITAVPKETNRYNKMISCFMIANENKDWSLDYWSLLITATLAPTNNCQFASIGSFSTLFLYGRQATVKILQEVQKVFLKPMFLLDIHNTAYGDFENLPKAVIEFFGRENIVLEQNYTSTNGSEMMLLLVKTKDIMNMKP